MLSRQEGDTLEHPLIWEVEQSGVEGLALAWAGLYCEAPVHRNVIWGLSLAGGGGSAAARSSSEQLGAGLLYSGRF